MVVHCHLTALVYHEWRNSAGILLNGSLQLQDIWSSYLWLPDCSGDQGRFPRSLQWLLWYVCNFDRFLRVLFRGPLTFIALGYDFLLSLPWCSLSGTRQYFSRSICVGLVIPRCPRWCATLTTFLWRIEGMMIDSF